MSSLYVYIFISNSVYIFITLNTFNCWWQSGLRFVPFLLSVDSSWMRILRLWLLFYLEWLIQFTFSTAPVSAILRTRVACSGFGICPSFSLQVEGVIWIASKHTSEARLFFGSDQWALELLGSVQGLPEAHRLRRLPREGGLVHTHSLNAFTLYGSKALLKSSGKVSPGCWPSCSFCKLWTPDVFLPHLPRLSHVAS